MRPKLVLGSALAVLALVAGCGSSDDGSSGANAVIKIGSLHPLTGALAADGKQMDAAIKQAATDINERGGIKGADGARLEIVSADSQGKPEIGQSEAQRMIDGGAVGLIGAFQSAVTTNVSAVAERSQIPFVIDVAAADSILDQGGRFTFRIQPNASSMGKHGADYLKAISDAAGVPVKTIAYMHEETAFGTSVFNAFKKAAEGLGMRIVVEIKFDAFKVTNLTTELSRVKASGADVLAVTGYYNDGLLLARNASAVKPAVKAVFGVAQGTYDLPQFPTDAGALAEYYFDSNYHFDAGKERVRKIRDAFKAATGEEMRTPAVLAYQAVEVLADAIGRAGSADRVKVRDALAKTSFDDTLLPFAGPIEFDETGENKNAQPVLMQVLNGTVTQVYPEEFAQAKPVFPATAWSKP